MAVIGVLEAADRLGLSAARVRQLAAAGVIPASKVGSVWAFDPGDLDPLPARRRVAGRPMSAAIAWAVLRAREGRDIVGLEPYAASRARRYAQRDIEDLWPRLARRARLHEKFAHPSSLERLRSDDRLVLGGVSAADRNGAGLVIPGEVEAYVRVSDLEDVLVEHGLIDATGEPNVFLRIVDDPSWPFDEGARLAPRSVVAVDLFERSRGPDRLRAAAQALSR